MAPQHLQEAVQRRDGPLPLLTQMVSASIRRSQIQSPNLFELKKVVNAAAYPYGHSCCL